MLNSATLKDGSIKRFSGALWAFGLVLLFVLSFALPLVFAYHVNSTPEDEVVSVEGSDEEYSPFEQNLIVTGPGSNLKIGQDLALEPEVGKDFIFFIWFRPKSVPVPGEQYVFVSKFDAQTKGKSGYAFGVARDSESVYPVVYWRNVAGDGKLFRFAEMSFVSKVWNLMAVSYQKGKYLGVHAGSLSAPGEISEVRLLGGYQTDVVPHSSADLVIGALKSGSYRGRIGALGILSAEGIGKNVEEVLKFMLQNPTKLPPSIEKDAVQLWTIDGIHDQSPIGHQLVAKGGILAGSKKKKTSQETKRTKRDD